MYDFLCLLPHTTASDSLIHYLNQHRLMHVAQFEAIERSLDDVFAYERNFRTWMPTIGISTRDYDQREIVTKILAATKRALLIQTVRDPVESFVAQTNNAFFVHRLKGLL